MNKDTQIRLKDFEMMLKEYYGGPIVVDLSHNKEIMYVKNTGDKEIIIPIEVKQ